MAKQYLCKTDRVQVGTKLYRAGEIVSFSKGVIEFDKKGEHPHWEDYDAFLKKEQERAAAQLTSTDSLENEIADLKTKLKEQKEAGSNDAELDALKTQIKDLTIAGKELAAKVEKLEGENKELVKAKGDLNAELELINEMTADNKKAAEAKKKG